MEPPAHLIRLQSECVMMGIDCPVSRVVKEDQWLVMELFDDKLPGQSDASLHAHNLDYFEMPNGEVVYRAVAAWEVPGKFYHGTSPAAAWKILCAGRFRLLGTSYPDGVHSYPSLPISMQSTYVAQGAQLVFKACGFPLSYTETRKWPQVIEGTMGRIKRSVGKANGAAGTEWIHHPGGIKLTGMRVKAFMFNDLFKDSPVCCCAYMSLQTNRYEQAVHHKSSGLQGWPFKHIMFIPGL